MFEAKRLLSTLNNARISASDNALYQTIKQLINAVAENINEISGRVTTIETTTGGGGSGSGLTNKTYLTHTDETPTLPFSRNLLAGANVSFDDSVAGKRTIRANILLTADPSTPADDTWWVVRTGTSPTMTVSLKARIGGTTYTIASITA